MRSHRRASYLSGTSPIFGRGRIRGTADALRSPPDRSSWRLMARLARSKPLASPQKAKVPQYGILGPGGTGPAIGNELSWRVLPLAVEREDSRRSNSKSCFGRL